MTFEINSNRALMNNIQDLLWQSCFNLLIMGPMVQGKCEEIMQLNVSQYLRRTEADFYFHKIILRDGV